MRHPTGPVRPNRFIAFLLSLAFVALAAAPAAALPCCADEAAVWAGQTLPMDAGTGDAFMVADLDRGDLDDDDLDPDEDALPAAPAVMRACRAVTPLDHRPPADRSPVREPASVFRPPRA